MAWLLGAWTARHLVVSPGLLWTLLALCFVSGLVAAPTRLLALAAACWAMAALHAGARAEIDPAAFRSSGPVTVEAQVVSHPRGRPGEAWTWIRTRSIAQRSPAGEHRRQGGVDLLLQLPDGAAAPAWGTIIRARGHLRRSTVHDNRVPVRRGPWRLRLKSRRFLDVVEPPGPVHRGASSLRRGVEGRLGGDQRPAHSLRRALLLGSADHLPERWRRSLRAAGLSHLLAVSGLHVGLVATLAWWLLLPLAGHRRLRLVAVLLAVTVFLLLVGPKPSALRAAAMAGLFLASLFLERPPQPLNALSVCVGALVILDPAVVDDLGFRLSVAATAGILVLAPLWTRRWTRLPRSLRVPLAVTCAAQCATLPLLLPWTGLVHPAAPLLNLVAIPWLALFLAASFLSLAVPFLTATLPALALPVEVLADLPASKWIASPLHLGTGASVVVALALALAATFPRRAGQALVVALLLGARHLPAEMGASGVESSADDGIELVQLDVGQGDALLLRGGGATLLVDGGGWRHGDAAGRLLVPALARLGVRRIDAAVMTHPDADHCRGLAGLTSYLPVEEVWAAPGWDDACAHALLGRRGVVWRPLWGGDTRGVGPWTLSALWPDPDVRHRGADNDGSLVLLARAGRLRLLLTGDVESRAERRLLRRHRELLRARVLKVAHHGSRSSSPGPFLRAVFAGDGPRLALVGAGRKNPYGHPHPDVVARLEEHDALVHRTDRGGLLHLRLPVRRPRGMPLGMPYRGKDPVIDTLRHTTYHERDSAPVPGFPPASPSSP